MPSTWSEPLGWLPALREPQLALSWTICQWQHVVPMARRLRLLSRLAAHLDAAGLIDQIPEAPRRHLIGEHRLSAWRVQAITWGMERIQRVLSDAPYPRVLLKGAAYLAQGLPIAGGRLPSDLDILVPQAHLNNALDRLQQDGWNAGDMSAPDLQYYREWSHEAPPMTHPLHRVELDLHHNILPPVARTTVDADLLLARLQPLQDTGWQVLHPVDQVLHSAAHLFLDSELQDRIRDLVDLDGLMRHFGRDLDFWKELPARAIQLGLAEPLALATHFTTGWLGTPVPASTLKAIEAIAPPAHRRAWLLPILEAALWPRGPNDRQRLRQEAAALVVLTRYHYNRLPVRLLIPHLWRKLNERQASTRD